MTTAFIQWTNKAGVTKSLYFDICTSEEQEFDSEATENPVEEGANVSDHVKRQLNRVALEIFVSNEPIEDVNKRGMSRTSVPLQFERYKAPLPLNPLGAATAVVGGAISSLLGGGPGEFSADVYKFSQEFDAVEETLATLETLRDTVQLVDVITSKRLHEGMFLEKINIARNAQTGSGATFRLEFRELRKVNVSLVAAPTIPAELRGNKKKDKGTKAPTPVPEGPKKSILKSGITNLLKR